jgi:hypothetical protein
LACTTFQNYVVGYTTRGRSRAPSHAVYVKVFRADDDHIVDASKMVSPEAVV